MSGMNPPLSSVSTRLAQQFPSAPDHDPSLLPISTTERAGSQLALKEPKARAHAMSRAFIIPPRKTGRRSQKADPRPVLQLPVVGPVVEVEERSKPAEPTVERGIAVIDFYI
jgi:hypothetical protein